MKEYLCISDIGSVLVGNKIVRFALPNIGGDGTTKLIVCDWDEESEATTNAEFVTCIEGEFNVFKYDCSDGSDEDVILALEGRYGIYKDFYKVILVKWE